MQKWIDGCEAHAAVDPRNSPQGEYVD